MDVMTELAQQLDAALAERDAAFKGIEDLAESLAATWALLVIEGGDPEPFIRVRLASIGRTKVQIENFIFNMKQLVGPLLLRVAERVQTGNYDVLD